MEIEVALFISTFFDVAGTDEKKGKETTPKGFIFLQIDYLGI